MKRWICTVPGKVILYIGCVLSTLVFAASLIAAIVLLDYGLDFYSRKEEEIRKEVVVHLDLASNVYTCLHQAVADGYAYDDGCLYRITDGKGKVVFVTDGAEESTDWQYTMHYGAVRFEDGQIDFYSIDDGQPYGRDGDTEQYTVQMQIPASTWLGRQTAFTGWLVHILYLLRYAVYGIGVGAFVLMVLTFVALMVAAGRRPDSDALYPGPFEVLPFDFIFVNVFSFALLLLYAVGTTFALRPGPLLFAGAAIAATAGALLLVCMSGASRLKRHTLWEKMLTVRIVRFLWREIKRICRFLLSLIRGLPLVWKSALAIGALTLLEFLALIMTIYEPPVLAFLFCLEKLFLIPAILYVVLCLRKLQQGGAALAGGDLSYQTDTKGMIGELKEHGEHLNSIAGGMAAALDERMKSERMKTALITNVSHDIKTPLTSIINYAALIGEEPCENEKITEYAEVLLRQSDKLKRLIDDLVEASKASTGNLDVILAPCDAGIFVEQAAGEYEERMNSCSLTLVTAKPDRAVSILADGRRMWRIFDNLMNNICKYAQPGTRVYLSLEEKDHQAVITFRNTSREMLNMSEEELMERFTRGDASRTTDGNGLGLSIARSLAELQRGSLDITIDGDLFKAVLRFPTIL